MVNLFAEKQASVFSVERIKPEETRRYGIVGGNEIEKGVMEVNELVEKPEPNKAPSLLGIQGRYVFTPDLFEYQKKVAKGVPVVKFN